MDETLLSSKEKFSRLVLQVRASNMIPWPMKVAMLQQVIVESSAHGKYANSFLANKFLNFTGMKHRPEITTAQRVFAITPSEPKGAYWCKFKTIAHFIEGYHQFVHRSPYPLVDSYDRINDREYLAYLHHSGYAEDPKYLSKLEKHRDAVFKWLGLTPFSAIDEKTPIVSPTGNYPAPTAAWVASPKNSSRRGKKVDIIVNHYTVTKTASSAIYTLTKGSRQASAHLVIGRDGKTTKLVNFDRAAWHAPGVNSRSIGIEHVAMPGQSLTAAQEKATILWQKHLLKKYGLSYKAITAHKWAPYATSCPGNLFSQGNPNTKHGTLDGFLEWRHDNFATEFPAKPGDVDRVVV